MSPSKSVKFKISLKDLEVTFEGDIQSAERMHGEIAGALNSLASAQKMLTAPPKPAPTTVVIDPAGGRRRSRRRRASGGNGVDSAIIDGAADGVAVAEADVGADDGGRLSRRAGPGAATLITQLKDEQFFNAKRTISDIRQELAKKGHTLQSSDISGPLLNLTQQQVLKRDKDPGLKQWVYFAA